MKKSIVLSALEESTQKGVLTLQEEEAGVSGTLRLYNFSRELKGICSLGVYVDKNVVKAGLTLKSHMFYEFFLDMKKIPAKFSVAVVNFQNAEVSPLLFGSSEGSSEDAYAEVISQISQVKGFEKTKQVLDEYGVDFPEEEKEIIEKEIDDALCDKDCANCVYKKFFFENSKEEEFSEEPVSSEQKQEFVESLSEITTENEEKPKEEEVELFFDKLKPQIDKLFAENPAEKDLQGLIPSSKWVKVDYEDEGDFYVFGILYDESGEAKYVCYGIPAVFDEKPPQELSGYPIWIPLKEEKGFGYWMTYQDASTGEPVKAIVD